MSNLKITLVPGLIEVEELRLGKNEVTGKLSTFAGQQGDFFVIIIPSLNVSGYGKNEPEAEQSIRENIDTFFQDLFALPEVDRHRELKNLGWQSNDIFRHQLSNSCIDEDGVLQNFDEPEKVKRSTLQAA